MPTDASREKDLFLAALERPTRAEQLAFLDAACSGDAGLRQRVDALLNAHGDSDSLLDHPASVAEAITDAATQSIARAGMRGAAQSEGSADALRGRTAAEQVGAATVQADLAFLAPAGRPGSLGRLDHYEVQEVVGKGGMGVVLKAFDEKLHRVVAIKALAPALATNATARKRFVREAQAAAAVSHDHVVAIYAVEDAGPVPFLVMQYIAGISLEDRIKQGGPLELKEILRIGLQTAHGLAAAHAQGLVHRDVKPANILLENGVQRVKITDFGLARAVDDASLTQSGVIAGTPMYMSPEQARGEPVDHRTDLFSLGSVLYALCAGRPPFRASSTVAVLKRVCEETPRAIRDCNAEIPEWLTTIVAKLHGKEPADRFQSAAEVAELLSKHLAHLQQPHLVPLPAAVRHTGSAPENQQAGSVPNNRRRRRIVAAAAVLLLAAGAITTYFMMRPGDRTVLPVGSTAVQGTDDAFDRMKREDIAPALLAVAGGGDPALAPPELVAVLGDARFRMPSGGPTSWMAQNNDGVLAIPCGNRIALYEAATGRLLRLLSGHTDRAWCVAFSPDGKRIVSGSWDRTLKVWDVRTGQETFSLTGHTDNVWSVAFSPNGQRIASASFDKTVRVWDATTGKELYSLLGHTGQILSVCFRPDSKRIASGSNNNQVANDYSVRVWDVDKAAELLTLQGHTAAVNRLAFSPDGNWLATGSDNELILWDAATLKETHTVKTPAGWLAFAPDSKTLFAGRHVCLQGQVHAVTRWEVAGMKSLPSFTLRSQGGGAVYHLSPDGKTLYGIRENHPPEPFAHAYDAQTGNDLFPRPGHIAPMWSVAVSADGRKLASGSADHIVQLWDLDGWKAGEALPPLRTLVGKYKQKGGIRSVAFSGDGKLLASGSEDGTIVLWDVATGAQRKTLRGNSTYCTRLAVSPDGQTLAAGSSDGKIRIWDVGSGKVGETIAGHGTRPVREVAFSPDGKLLASAGEDGCVRLWELPGGDLLNEFESKAVLTSVAFSQDGKMLATGSDAPESLVRVWDITDPSNWHRKADRRGHSSHVFTLAFQPGGKLLATGGWDGTVRVSDLAADDKPALTIERAFGANVYGVAFSPKGGYLVAANENGTISVLRAPTPAYLESLEKKQRLVFATWANAIAGRKTTLHRTIASGDPLGAAFEDVPADGALLVGLTGQTAPWGGIPEVVASIRPIYLTAGGIREGPDFGKAMAGVVRHFRLQAREGYAVGGIVERSGMAFDGFKLIFMRIDGPQLDPDDRYESEWVGTRTPGGPASRISDGKPTVGVHGRQGGIDPYVRGVGFVQRTVQQDLQPTSSWQAHHRYVSAVLFAEDGKTLISASKDGFVKRWRAEPGKGPADAMQTIAAQEDGVRALARAADGKTLATAGFDGVIRLWDAQGNQLHELPGHKGGTTSLLFGANGSQLVSGGVDGKVRFWSWRAEPRKGPGDNHAFRELDASKEAITILSLASDGKTLATNGSDLTARLRDVGTMKMTTSLPDRIGAWMSPDGTRLAVVTGTGVIELRDAASGEVRTRLRGYTEVPDALSFSADGKLLASCGKEGSLRVWDVSHGHVLAVLRGYQARPCCVALAADGKKLAAGCEDGTLLLWVLSD